ncbi:MAG: serine/threonine-protein kinase [Actinomycetota bacterium]
MSRLTGRAAGGDRTGSPAGRRHTPAAGSDEPEAAAAQEHASWAYAEGDPIAPGLRAWACLGGGKRFETWLAWDTRRWAPVTVKLPRPDRVDELSREALADEARYCSRVRHPSIQRLLDVAVDPEAVDAPAGTLPHLVFEYVEGPAIPELVGEEPLGPGDVCRLGMQVAAALHHLHGAGLVHRDVKPANVVVAEGRPVLIDFDLTCEAGYRSRSGGAAAGSALYMAPDQILGVSASPAMDVFGLGTVLYESATSHRAFDWLPGEGDDVYPTLIRRPEPPSAIVAGVPPSLESVILALLEPDPADRPATARAVLGLLAGALPPEEEATWPGWVTRFLEG